MTRSVRRLARLALLAIVCSCATGPLSVHAGGMLAAPTVAVAAGRLTLRVSPARVVLGQRFTVLLVGAQPRVVYTFVMAPRHAQGFGGGLMGRYRADGHGLVRFSYPGPTGRWEIGQWRLSATPPAMGSHLIGATTVFVVTATVATHLANSPDPLIYTARGTLWTLTIGGVRQALLAPGSGVSDTGDVAPALAPDGHHLLYSTGRGDLWVLNTWRGSPRRVLSLSPSARLGPVAWSSDSTGIVYVVFKPDMPAHYRGLGIYSWTLDTLTLTSALPHLVARSTKNPPYGYEPRPLGWSRHAHQIFLQEAQDGGATAYDVITENGAFVARYQTPRSVQIATLSRDQTRLVIVNLATSPTERGEWTVRSATQPSHVLLRLRPRQGWYLSAPFLAWSSDGHAVAYSTYPILTGDTPIDQTVAELRIASVATGQTRLVRQDRGINTHVAAWSPDRRTLLVEKEVMRGNLDTSVFYTVRPDGTGVRSLDLSRSRHETVVGWAAHP